MVSSSPAAISLNRRTPAAQTPVSTLGKMLSTVRVPAGRVTSLKSEPVSVKVGAVEPSAGSSPTVWAGVPPRAVVAMTRSYQRPG